MVTHSIAQTGGFRLLANGHPLHKFVARGELTL